MQFTKKQNNVQAFFNLQYSLNNTFP